MPNHSNTVIVEEGLISLCSVHTKNVYHRDFPEARAECGSLADALVHLTNQLARASEYVGSELQRSAIKRAINDIADYRSSLADSEPESLNESP